MARSIHSRLKIQGILVTETPLHVGGFGTSSDTDLPLAQNGKGEWYIPGTSIAGVLRSWSEMNFGEVSTDEIFGWKSRTSDKGKRPEDLGHNKHASFFLVEDATVTLPDALSIEIRDGVRIDRFYGTAGNKAKFDQAILPRGSRLDVEMIVEINKEESSPSTKALVGHMLDALVRGKIRLGAAHTRGLGRLRLLNDSSLSIKQQELVGFDAIINMLEGKSADLSINDLKKDGIVPEPPAELTLEIHWKPRLPVMVKAGYDGVGVDVLPLVSGFDNNTVSLLLPGSSLKGALRSHAERIVRTVLALPLQDRQNGHEQMDVPLVNELFGIGVKSKEERAAADAPHLGLGALSVDDCYAEEAYAMSPGEWSEVEVAGAEKEKSSKEWELTKKLTTLKSTSRFKMEHHVAIDRWTGGASEGALYSVLTPVGILWAPIRLSVDLSRIDESTRSAATMLLFLTLRDVAENRLPFGFATNRGMGELEVETITITGEALTGNLRSLEGTSTISTLSDLNPNIKSSLKTEWETWQKNTQPATR